MKRRIFAWFIFVLTVVMICGLSFVACKKKKPQPTTPGTTQTQPEVPAWQDKTVSTTEIINTLWDRMAADVTIGEEKKFIADFDALVKVDHHIEGKENAQYKFVVRADVDAGEKQDGKMLIELVETVAQKQRVLFGLACDIESTEDCKEPYVYINILGKGYRKFNGYSLAQLITTLQPQNSEIFKGDRPKTLLNLFVSVTGLFESKGKLTDEGNTYVLNMNPAQVFKNLAVLPSDKIFAQLGIEPAQANAAIQEIAKRLGKDKIVDFQTLCTELSTVLKYTKATCFFRFDADKKFVNAEVQVNYNKNNGTAGEPHSDYTLTVNRARISTGTLNVFEGSGLTEEVRKQDALNLLNFSLKGNAVSYKGEEIAHRYGIEVQSDLDAFELLALVKNTSKANIVSTLKKLGYFHLEINEVDNNGQKLVNILTVHSKFDEGFFVVNANLNDAQMLISLPIGLGGVYEFEGLIDVIGMLKNADGAASANAAVSNKPALSGNGASDKESGQKPDVLGIVKELSQFVHADNFKADGVTVELQSLIVKALETFGVRLEGKLNDVLAQVLDCDTVNIKLQTPAFGTCVQVGTDTVESGIRTASAFRSGKDIIKEVVSLDALNTEILEGDSNLKRYLSGSYEAGKCFAITGKNLKGETVATSGYIMAYEGLDVNTPGEQEVTFYIAIGTDLVSTINLASIVADIKLSDLLPLNGVLKYTATLTVSGYDESAEISIANLAETKEIRMDTSEAKSWFGKVKKSSYSDIVLKLKESSFKLTESDARILKDGIDVTQQVFADGMNVAGTYTVTVGIGKYRSTEYTFFVDAVYLERNDGGSEPTILTLGDAYQLADYTVVMVDSNGKRSELTAEPVYKIGYKTMKLEEIFDIKDGVYTLKRNLDFIGKKFSIVYSVQTAGGKREFTVEIPVTGPELKKGSSVQYFGTSLNGYLTLTSDGTQYLLQYESGKWVLKSADGKVKSAEIVFEWGKEGSGDTVQFNDKGRIARYPNENKSGSRYAKIYYMLTFDGYRFDGSFTVYELSVSDKTSWLSSLSVGDRLAGAISYVNKIEYRTEDGQIAELEFKYGGAGFGIYIKDTDTKVYDVTVKVFNGEEDVTASVLADGAFTTAGTYKVTYDLEIDGIAQNFFHNVKVK